ncbi:MAG: hypothetical protein P1U88_08085 [Thalassobaculaceae bacterium]|nr:hypothetical protein [Thalassobaculaceae bacterium]
MPSIADLLRPIREDRARAGVTITYADLARAAGVPSPHRIHKTGDALEVLMEADAAAGRPLLAAVAISKARDGAPAPGFFQKAAELGLYFGPDRGAQATMFHRLELAKVWSAYAA